MTFAFVAILALAAITHLWRMFSKDPPAERTVGEVQAWAAADFIFEILLLIWLVQR